VKSSLAYPRHRFTRLGRAVQGFRLSIKFMSRLLSATRPLPSLTHIVKASIIYLTTHQIKSLMHHKKNPIGWLNLRSLQIQSHQIFMKYLWNLLALKSWIFGHL